MFFIILPYVCLSPQNRTTIWAASIENAPSNMRNMRRFRSTCTYTKYKCIIRAFALHSYRLWYRIILLTDTEDPVRLCGFAVRTCSMTHIRMEWHSLRWRRNPLGIHRLSISSILICYVCISRCQCGRLKLNLIWLWIVLGDSQTTFIRWRCVPRRLISTPDRYHTSLSLDASAKDTVEAEKAFQSLTADVTKMLDKWISSRVSVI